MASKKKYTSLWFRFNRKINRIAVIDKIILKRKLKDADFILLMSPTHGNLGDQAIVCAEEQIIKASGKKMVEIPEIEMKKREKAFAEFIPQNKTILIHGGGFLGDIWPEEEYEFRRILEEFKDFRVIVFPQTVTFDLTKPEGRKFFNESKKIYENHNNLHVFVRDERTYKFMKENMCKIHCDLVPDVVTQLSFPVEQNQRNNILVCMRADHEKKIDETLHNSIIELIKKKYPNEDIIYTDTLVEGPIYADTRISELKCKFNQFAESKLVITDRLHGMLFSAITNTPCIAFNNANGKVIAQYNWIKENSYIKVAENAEEFEIALNTVNTQIAYKYTCEFAKENMQSLYEMLERC